MARSHTPKWYCEPWHPVKGTAWELGFQHKPAHGDTPEAAAQAVLDWESARDKAEKEAPWFARGSGLEKPTLCRALTGSASVTDGGRLILTGHRMLGLPDGAPDHGSLVRRACEAVNAVEGIQDPVKLIKDIRSLLLDLARGVADGGDFRVTSCLGRMIPPGEYSNGQEED